MTFENHIGLDIGTTSIKLAQLAKSATGRFSLVAVGEIAISKSDDPQAEIQLKADAIKELIRQTKVNNRLVTIALPESQVYTRVIEMPVLSQDELSSAIHWQAEQYIPVPLSDIVLKHTILSTPSTNVPGSKMKVLLVASPNTVIENYQSIIRMTGLETIAIETEVLSVIRSLFEVGTQKDSSGILVHLGAETSTVVLMDKGQLTLTRTVSSGGITISRSIANQLGIDVKQADEYKRTYGLDETKLDGKVSLAIKPILETIIAELRKVLAFNETQTEKENLQTITLSGGGAFLPAIVPFMTQSLGLEVILGNPFTTIDLTDAQRKSIGESGPLYTTAIGLALKET